MNLQNWGGLEEKHTNTYVGMYQFWVLKYNLTISKDSKIMNL